MAVRARLGEGWSLAQSVPLGWNASALGLGLFALGFLGDGIWHTIYGIEADLEALLSPTHLFMLAGGLTIMLSALAPPFGSRWRVLRAAGAVIARYRQSAASID